MWKEATKQQLAMGECHIQRGKTQAAIALQLRFKA